ncbi:MAG: hypothetical protein KGJ13_03825 [Patescibacteria group bacterium]|nr:hypothetical protein [Patescibacteria group bacterium]
MKREIYALDYAVASIIAALDCLFRTEFLAGLRVERGLDVEIVSKALQDVKVFVQPVGWDERSGISIRLKKNDASAWEAFEGALTASHLPSEFASFTFECCRDLMGIYRFSGRGTSNELLLGKLLTARTATKSKQD